MHESRGTLTGIGGKPPIVPPSGCSFQPPLPVLVGGVRVPDGGTGASTGAPVAVDVPVPGSVRVFVADCVTVWLAAAGSLCGRLRGADAGAAAAAAR